MNSHKRVQSLQLAFAAAVTGLSFAIVSGASVAAPPSPHVLKAKPFSIKVLQQAVESSDVRVIKSVALLPPDVRVRFRETVHSKDEKIKLLKNHQIDMANPGQSWNASDNRKEGLPNRQLQFAGTAGNKCFVVFNTASIRGRMQWVAVFDLSRKPASLLGVASATSWSSDLATLCKMVKSKAFGNAPNSRTIPL